jgi:hypothetical protein
MRRVWTFMSILRQTNGFILLWRYRHRILTLIILLLTIVILILILILILAVTGLTFGFRIEKIVLISVLSSVESKFELIGRVTRELCRRVGVHISQGRRVVPISFGRRLIPITVGRRVDVRISQGRNWEVTLSLNRRVESHFILASLVLSVNLASLKEIIDACRAVCWELDPCRRANRRWCLKKWQGALVWYLKCLWNGQLIDSLVQGLDEWTAMEGIVRTGLCWLRHLVASQIVIGMQRETRRRLS